MLYPKRVIFHCDDETLAEVLAYAKRERVTRAEAMRRLLRQALKTAAIK